MDMFTSYGHIKKPKVHAFYTEILNQITICLNIQVDNSRL